MKYIPVDKLIAEIERLFSSEHPIEYEPIEKLAYNRALSEIKDAITSLQQEQLEVDLEKVWNWIDNTFRETEVNSRYGESRNVLMSDYDLLKSDLREKYERDFGINARKEEML